LHLNGPLVPGHELAGIATKVWKTLSWAQRNLHLNGPLVPGHELTTKIRQTLLWAQRDLQPNGQLCQAMSYSWYCYPGKTDTSLNPRIFAHKNK
jgi:hypothetical protein